MSRHWSCHACRPSSVSSLAGTVVVPALPARQVLCPSASQLHEGPDLRTTALARRTAAADCQSPPRGGSRIEQLAEPKQSITPKGEYRPRVDSSLAILLQ